MEQMFWSLLLGSHVVEPTSELLRDLCKNLGIMRIVSFGDARHSVTHFLLLRLIFQRLHPGSLPAWNGAIRSAGLLYGCLTGPVFYHGTKSCFVSESEQVLILSGFLSGSLLNVVTSLLSNIPIYGSSVARCYRSYCSCCPLFSCFLTARVSLQHPGLGRVRL